MCRRTIAPALNIGQARAAVWPAARTILSMAARWGRASEEANPARCWQDPALAGWPPAERGGVRLGRDHQVFPSLGVTDS